MNVYVEVYGVKSRKDSRKCIYKFSLKSMILSGYHKDKSLWINWFDGEELIGK